MKSESINELAMALAKAQSEIKSAHKDAANPFFKSKYADLTSVWDACREALNKNGLSIVQTVTAGEFPALITSLIHSSGQFIDGQCPLINTKGDMQGLGSAISYARRYGLSAMVGVVAEDDDANTADQKTHQRTDSQEPCTAKQAAMIKAKLANANIVGLDAATLLNKFGTHLPERIPFHRVNELLADIESASKKKTTAKTAANKGIVDREDEPPFDPDLAWSGKR